jgi:hypothetical protein
LVKCPKESAGKKYGTSGKKIGNAYLKGAFSEAAVLFLRNTPEGQNYRARLENKHGKGKAHLPRPSSGPHCLSSTYARVSIRSKKVPKRLMKGSG